MKPNWLVLAEGAKRRADGRLDISGVHRSAVVKALPATVPVVVVMEVRVTEPDRQRKQNILTIRIKDPKGRTHADVTSSHLDCKTPKGHKPIATWEFTVPLNLHITEAGRYAIEIRHNGLPWQTQDLMVTIASR